MPTLDEVKMFQFHEKARGNINEQMKGWLENEKAINIIINVLKMKLAKTGKENRLYFLKGRTGSGKSTFMIQEVFKAIVNLLEYRSSIFCTQPRVVLTKSNPHELIRYNKGWEFGVNIGVRNGNERINITTERGIFYCTTQIMSNVLVELMMTEDKMKQKQIMRGMRIVVVDECHVLDSPMMALLKNVYDVVNKFGDEEECPLFIFSSATIDLDNMVKYYFQDKAEEMLKEPLVCGEVEGKPNYPVEEVFMKPGELKEMIKREKKGNNVFELYAEWFVNNWLKKVLLSKSVLKFRDEMVKCRDSLLFVPLFSAIEFIGDYLEKKIGKKIPFKCIRKGEQFKEVEKWRNENRGKTRILYVGYGRNYAPASDEVLALAVEKDEESRKNEIKIICSTSVIETGKTIATLYLCADIGFETMTIYNPLAYKPGNNLRYLKQVPINKNQAIQRKGRVGRECEGLFVHFYSKECYEKLRVNDIPETINNSYLSALVLNDLSQFQMGIYKDVFNLNNYYYPTSTDILINSARDLVNAGYLTLFGQFVALNNSIKHCENWIIYAKYLFYVLGWSLWSALLLASLNRKHLPPMMTLFSVQPEDLRIQLRDVREETINDDMIESIQRARNALTSILYGNDETFRCSEERVYKERDEEDEVNEIRVKGGRSEETKISCEAFDEWHMLNDLGRI